MPKRIDYERKGQDKVLGMVTWRLFFPLTCHVIQQCFTLVKYFSLCAYNACFPVLFVW